MFYFVLTTTKYTVQWHYYIHNVCDHHHYLLFYITLHVTFLLMSLNPLWDSPLKC